MPKKTNKTSFAIASPFVSNVLPFHLLHSLQFQVIGINQLLKSCKCLAFSYQVSGVTIIINLFNFCNLPALIQLIKTYNVYYKTFFSYSA